MKKKQEGCSLPFPILSRVSSNPSHDRRLRTKMCRKFLKHFNFFCLVSIKCRKAVMEMSEKTCGVSIPKSNGIFWNFQILNSSSESACAFQLDAKISFL